MKRAEALGMAAGVVADRVFADPQRGHPVAVFGSAVARTEKRVYADSRAAGAVFATVLVLRVLARPRGPRA